MMTVVFVNSLSNFISFIFFKPVMSHYNLVWGSTYGTCHKKLYEISGLSASVIRSFSTASPRISTES